MFRYTQVATSDEDLAAAVLDDVQRVAGPLGVEAAMPDAPIGKGWDATRRRTGAGGPSDEVLYHLRGTKNAVFKLT